MSSSSPRTLSPRNPFLRFDMDPYLQYRPPFARSLPVQVLLTGIVFTLVAVLFIHLILTAQYHWPLAPTNYVLQLSGVCTLLISLIATLHVILSATFSESEQWPYMLSYIAVNVPPLEPVTAVHGWTPAERVLWLVMNASTSGLVQVSQCHRASKLTTVLYLYSDNAYPFFDSSLPFSPRRQTDLHIARFVLSRYLTSYSFPTVIRSLGNPSRSHATAAYHRNTHSQRYLLCRSERLQCNSFITLHCCPFHMGLSRKQKTGMENRRWHSCLRLWRHLSGHREHCP